MPVGTTEQDATGTPAPRTVRVPVDGGDLTVGVWGDGAPVALAVHGITASHRAWSVVAGKLGGTLIAPDLRGRGGSAELPGPYGMTRHADDCVAVLDALEVPDAVVAGHSMGGFVAAVMAHRRPDRVRRLVLIDGGAPLPVPDAAAGASVDQVLEAVIGPAARRLSMRFDTREAYRRFWREHPALAAAWSPAVESYVDYDLAGEPGALRSRAALHAVREDTVDIHQGSGFREAFAALADGGTDALFLAAERGMRDEPVPLYPDPTPVSRLLPYRTVPGTNHYTILFGEAGASAVAAAIAS